MLTGLLLALSLAIVLLAAELFTNSVEWVGHKLDLNEGVVGSVLAAVGTATPETLIPIVAFAYADSGHHGDEIGIGAILGAPFMLATLAMFVTGLAVVLFVSSGRRTAELRVSSYTLGRDIRYFLVAYLVVILVALTPNEWFALRVAASAFVLGLYAFYVYRHATDPGEAAVTRDEAEDMSPLHFHRRAENPRFWRVVAQLVASVLVMLGGAYLFVQSVDTFAIMLRVPPLILSLLIAPIATELPEKMNSVLWVRQGKDTLALGNLTGAMVFQSCIPAAVGMLFATWTVTAETSTAFVSAAIAVVASAVIFGRLGLGGRKLTVPALLAGGGFYLLYLAYVVLMVAES